MRIPSSWLITCLYLFFQTIEAKSYATYRDENYDPFYDEYPVDSPPSPRGSRQIAIIGAGAAGTSAAYYLSKYGSPCRPANITIFERSSYIGGRSTTVDVFSDSKYPVELGASIFVQVNYNLVSAVDTFNLTLISDKSESEDALEIAVWDGESFVFQKKYGTSWWDVAKLFWKYGVAPLRVQRLMKSTVGRFLKLYAFPQFPFYSLSEAAADVGLLDRTGVTGAQYLDAHWTGGAFAQEIVQASTRVNYGQNLELIHGLESMVCMATEGAMSVKGGNWRIFDAMAKESGANVRLDTEVTAIQKLDNGTYTIATSRSNTSQAFDVVILAAPYQFSNIALPNSTRTPDEIPYVKLYVTLFTSPYRLSSAYFNVPEDGSSLPDTILTTLHPSDHLGSNPDGVGKAGFWSISRLTMARNPSSQRLEHVYKIFSPRALNETFIHSLLAIPSPSVSAEEVDFSADELKRREPTPNTNPITWLYTKTWHSYPYLYPRVTFEDIQLDRHFYYTSGIESFISTMETSSLMGMNVAALIMEKAHHFTKFTRDGRYYVLGPEWRSSGERIPAWKRAWVWIMEKAHIVWYGY